MADTTYSVALEDGVSAGLSKISKEKAKLDKQFAKSSKVSVPKLPKVIESTGKAIDRAGKKSGGFLEKLDKGLGMLSQPINQVAGKFGMMGDAIEGSTGKLIAMGGAAGVVGASVLGLAAGAAIVVGGMYGIAKAALFADEQTTKFNKTILVIRGNLGKYSDQTKAVIDQSMKMNVAMGKPFEDVALSIAKAVKAGADLNTATDFASLTNSMTYYGEAGAKVNDVLDQLASGKKFSKTQADIDRVQYALNQVGLGKKIKAVDFINLNSSKKQLAMILANKAGIKEFAREAAASVPLMDKLKNAFSNMLAKVFGGQGVNNPLQEGLDAIIKWTEDPKNIEDMRTFFSEASKMFGKMLTQVPEFLSSLKGVMNTASRILEIIRDAIDLYDKWRGKPTRDMPTPISKAIEIKKLAEPIPVEGVVVDKNGNLTTTPPPAAKPPAAVTSIPSLKTYSVTPVESTPVGPTASYGAVTSGMLASNTISNTIDITINPSADSDPTQIAKAVGRELTKRLDDLRFVAGATSVNAAA